MENKTDYQINKIEDNPIVFVKGNLEKAINQLRRRTQTSGYLKILQTRQRHPSPADRRRRKKYKSMKRYQRSIKQMEKK